MFRTWHRWMISAGLLCGVVCGFAQAEQTLLRRQANTPAAQRETIRSYSIDPKLYDLFVGQAQRIYLNGPWKLALISETGENPKDDLGRREKVFRADYDDSAWDDFPVPWSWNARMEGLLHKTFRGVGWYRRTFDVPKAYQGKRLILHFRYVETEAEVYVNGKRVGEHVNLMPANTRYFINNSGDSFEFDITDFVRFGQANTVVVRVYADFAGGPKGFGQGGITESVWIDVRPPVYIHQARITCTSPKEGKVTIKADVVNTTEKNHAMKVQAVVTPWTSPRYKLPGGRTTQKEINLGTCRPGLTTRTFKMTLPDPVPWSPDRPFLYHLRLLDDHGELLGQERFGLRRLVTSGNRFLLNGKKIYLTGEQLHSIHGAVGTDRACNGKNHMGRALRRYRDANVNYVRTHSDRYPEAFYDLTDEMGVMICDELAMRWAARVVKNHFVVSPAMREKILHRMRLNWNHPSVVVYSMGNELWDAHGTYTPYAKAINALYDLFKKADPSRLVISSSGRFCTKYGPLAKSDFEVFHSYIGYFWGSYLGVEPQIDEYAAEMKRTYGSFNRPMINGECLAWYWNLPKPWMAFRAQWPKIDRKMYADLVPAYLRPPGLQYPIPAQFIRYSGIRNLVNVKEAARVRATYIKRVLEAMRRKGDVQAGFTTHCMLSREITPWGQTYPIGQADEATWRPGEGYLAIQAATRPFFVCMNVFDKNLFAGGSLQGQLHVMNDTPENIDGVQIRAEIIQLIPAGAEKVVDECYAYGRERKYTKIEYQRPTFTEKVVAQQTIPVGQLQQGRRKVIPYRYVIPKQAPTGRYRIRLTMTGTDKGGKAHCDNRYNFRVLGAADRRTKIATTKKIALYEAPKGSLGKILDQLSIPYERVVDFDHLKGFDVLIVGPGVLDAKAVKAAGKIHKWLRVGRRLICFEQSESRYIPWVPQMKFTGAGGTPFADVIVPEHPIFQGLGPEDFDTWNGPDRSVFATYLKPIGECVLAAGYGQPGADSAGMTVAEVRVVKGISLFSQLDAVRRYGKDSAATQYIENLLHYCLAGPWGQAYTGKARGKVRRAQPKAVDPKTCFFVNLRKHCNQGLADEVAGDRKGGWTDQGENDMRHFPTGVRSFAGVPFEIIDPKTNNDKACIVLEGTARPYFPQSVTSIPVGRKAKKLFFLLAMAWGGGGGQTPVAQIVVHYEGGAVGQSKIEIPIVEGVHVNDWWDPKDNLPEARLAWEKAHPNSGANVGVYLLEWKNPEGDGVIDRLDILRPSSGKQVPILLGVTGQ